MESFREELAAMGYKFQFITLAGFHALNTSMFELARAYKERGMAGYFDLQEQPSLLPWWDQQKKNSFIDTFST